LNPEQKYKRKEHLAKAVFLILPTWLVCFFMLWISNQYYAVIMHNQYLLQSIYIGAGMLASVIFYAFRFRFLPTFGLLVLCLYLLYSGIDNVVYGEFDSFFYGQQFFLFAFLFSLGWFLSWGFLRQQRFPIVVSGIFFISSIYLIAKQNNLDVAGLLQAFVPLVLYTVYIFYAVQVFAQHKDRAQHYWGHLLKRLGIFIGFALVLIFSVVWFMSGEIKAKVDEFGGGGKSNKESMLKKNKDGTFSLEEYTKLRSNLGRTNELLFVAKIDNFFEDGTANPLYLTGFYYSKYDPASETFEPDTLLPESDLFKPNPSKVGLYFTQSDSAVLKDALKQEYLKTVNIEVYKTLLSPNEFIAPTTSFFLQPIAVDRNNKQEFKSAYRAKSLVSELNSAYFVYNPGGNAMLEQFQEMRFEKLRMANDYSKVSPKLMQYYTSMPKMERFQQVADLAKKITAGKTTNVDKVLAIRDYFLSKDENGKPLFKYSDNPGIPDIPSASKLNYFLFENRKGYCAYYAGATLFMLRSLGIPSRIVAGFLTQDRNPGNNKGWYWYYADQAHAWVQVYFPGYGWLDFDTTVGNEEAQQAPKPDGTPPENPGNALLAIDGVVTDVDTLRKMATIKALKMVFKDKPYEQLQEQQVQLDLSVATIMKDSLKIPVTALNVADSVTAVSFAEAFKPIVAPPNVDGKTLLKRFPSPAPIDEVQVKVPHIADQKVIGERQKQATTPVWQTVLWITGAVLLLGLIIFWSLAPLYRLYLRLRRKMSRTFPEQAYWDFRYTQFVLHQLGNERNNLSAFSYAQKMDRELPLKYAQFVQLYLKLKYSETALSGSERQFMQQYVKGFEGVLRYKLPAKKRFRYFANPMRTIAFLQTKP